MRNPLQNGLFASTIWKMRMVTPYFSMYSVTDVSIYMHNILIYIYTIFIYKIFNSLHCGGSHTINEKVQILKDINHKRKVKYI